jgi:hypothetical protein
MAGSLFQTLASPEVAPAAHGMGGFSQAGAVRAAASNGGLGEALANGVQNFFASRNAAQQMAMQQQQAAMQKQQFNDAEQQKNDVLNARTQYLIGKGVSPDRAGVLAQDPATFGQVVDELNKAPAKPDRMAVDGSVLDFSNTNPDGSPKVVYHSPSDYEQLQSDYQTALKNGFQGSIDDFNAKYGKAAGKGAANPADEEQAQQIADAIARGEQPPTLNGLYRLGGPVRANLAKQGYDLTKANQEWVATQKYLATLNSPQQLRLAQNIDFTAHSLELVDQLAQQWDAGKYPALNAADLKTAKEGFFHTPEQQALANNLSSAIADVTASLGNVYMGGNSPTDHSLELAGENLKDNWSTKTIHSAIDQIRKTLQYRQNAMRNIGVAGLPNGNAYGPSGNAPLAPIGGSPRAGDTPAPSSAAPAATAPAPQGQAPAPAPAPSAAPQTTIRKYNPATGKIE